MERTVTFNDKEIAQIFCCRGQLKIGIVDTRVFEVLLDKIVGDKPPLSPPGKRRSTAAEREAKYTAKFKLKHPEFYK